mgnify:CR=1 FL=1
MSGRSHGEQEATPPCDVFSGPHDMGRLGGIGTPSVTYQAAQFDLDPRLHRFCSVRWNEGKRPRGRPVKRSAVAAVSTKSHVGGGTTAPLAPA